MDSPLACHGNSASVQQRIGGEFEIPPYLLVEPPCPLQLLPGEGYYASGRSALAAILRDARRVHFGDVVLVPDYVCESVIDTVVAVGLRPVHYVVTPSLSVDLDSVVDLAKEHRVSLVGALFVDYFGLSECDTWVSAFKAELPEVPVIKDCVQALYQMDAQAADDYRFSSLRKWLPTPDGAPLVSRHSTVSAPSESGGGFVAHKLLGNIERYWTRHEVQAHDDAGYTHVEEGERALKALGVRPHAMSRVSRVILSNIKLGDVAARRRRNFEILSKLIGPYGLRPILELSDGRVPHFLPVSVENRDQVRASLRAEGIFCPVHWPRSSDYPSSGQNALLDNELSLVVDQRYETQDMERLGAALGRALVGR